MARQGGERRAGRSRRSSSEGRYRHRHAADRARTPAGAHQRRAGLGQCARRMALGSVADAGDGPAVHRQRGRAAPLPRPARSRAGARPRAPLLALRSGHARAQQAACRRAAGTRPGWPRSKRRWPSMAPRSPRPAPAQSPRSTAAGEAPDDEFARAAIALEGWAAATSRPTLRANRSRDAAAGRATEGPAPAGSRRHSTAPSACPPPNPRPASRRRCCSAWCSPTPISSTERRGQPPLLLLDEVAAHLDPKRRAALFARLEGRGQVWMTATEAALFDGIGDRLPLPRPAGADRLPPEQRWTF